MDEPKRSDTETINVHQELTEGESEVLAEAGVKVVKPRHMSQIEKMALDLKINPPKRRGPGNPNWIKAAEDRKKKPPKQKRPPGNPNWVKGQAAPFMRTKEEIAKKQYRIAQERGEAKALPIYARIYMDTKGRLNLQAIADNKKHPRQFDALKLMAAYGYGQPTAVVLGVAAPAELVGSLQEKFNNAFSGIRAIGTGIPPVLEPAGGVEQEKAVGGIPISNEKGALN